MSDRFKSGRGSFVAVAAAAAAAAAARSASKRVDRHALGAVDVGGAVVPLADVAAFSVETVAVAAGTSRGVAFNSTAPIDADVVIGTAVLFDDEDDDVDTALEALVPLLLLSWLELAISLVSLLLLLVVVVAVVVVVVAVVVVALTGGTEGLVMKPVDTDEEDKSSEEAEEEEEEEHRAVGVPTASLGVAPPLPPPLPVVEARLNRAKRVSCNAVNAVTGGALFPNAPAEDKPGEDDEDAESDKLPPEKVRTRFVVEEAGVSCPAPPSAPLPPPNEDVGRTDMNNEDEVSARCCCWIFMLLLS